MNRLSKTLVIGAISMITGTTTWAVDDVVRKKVSVSKPKQMLFENILKVTGDFQAKTTAVIFAKVSEVLQQIHVDEGDKVIKGKTKLFESESSNLHEAVVIKTHQLSVAQASIDEKKASLERVMADFKKSKLDYERYKRLYENDKAVTQNAYELQETKYLQLKASIKHAQTLVALAMAQQKQTDAQLVISNKNLSDTKIIAPISGTITNRYAEPGERVNVGQRILDIADLSLLEVSIRIPEDYYEKVTVGTTKIRVKTGSINLGELVVSFKSPIISRDLRTFEVKALLNNPPLNVTAGRVADVEVVLNSRMGLGVDESSVVKRAKSETIFTVNSGVANIINVTTGLKKGKYVEILKGLQTVSTPVVISGQYFLNDGDSITIQKGN